MKTRGRKVPGKARSVPPPPNGVDDDGELYPNTALKAKNISGRGTIRILDAPRMPAMPPHSPPVLALALVVLSAAACVAPAPRQVSAPPGAGPPSWSTPILAEGVEAFVPGGATGLTWLGIISHEVPYDQAAYYCRRLPTHKGAPWRVPDLAELRQAPFDRYRLPEEPVRLWSGTPEPGELYRRWVVDPRTGAPEIKEVRQGIHVRVLCVSGRAPAGRAIRRAEPGSGAVLWWPEPSPFLPYAAAEGYCARLGAGGRTWRLPTAAELADAPLDRIELPDDTAELWSATVPEDRPGLRIVMPVGPRAGAPPGPARDPASGLMLRALCVVGARQP